MSILHSIRSFFNPGVPAIQTRDEMMGIDQRSAAGMTLYPSHQMNRPVWQTGSTQRYVTEGWMKSPVVFACVLALADAVTTAPIVVTEDTGDGQHEPVAEHPLLDLIQRPNPSMDGSEFFQAVTVIAALSGFCVIEKERSRLGEVVNLWPLRSDWVRPIPRDQSAPAWEYRVPGRRTPFILEPEDVIVHTHAPDPNMGYTGTAPMAVAFRELGVENAMTDFLKAFFDGGAVPQYGIIPRTQIKNQEMADAFLEKVRGKFRETNGGPMLLTGVEDIKRIGFNFDELAYPQLRNLSEISICSAFRVPPVLVGIQAGLDASTYSNYESSFSYFFRTTVTSMWRRLDGALTRGLVSDFDDTGALNIEFDLSQVDALQEDEAKLWQRATAALQAGGISLHTFQKYVGLDPHGPDVIYQPYSVTPIPIAATTDSRAVVTGRIDRIPVRALSDGRSKRAIAYDSEEHRERWERRLAVTDRWEEKIAAMTRSQMELQLLDVKERLLGSGRSTRDAVTAADDPFDIEKWIRSFKVEARPIITNIVTEQALLAAGDVGYSVVFDVHDPHVIQAIDGQTQRFAEQVNETTWENLRTSLSEGIANGESADLLADRVEEIMRGRIKSSKEAIARTEATAASTIGTQESWRQSGVVSGKEWIAALDDRTRDTHIHAHGQVVGIDDDFTVGGATGPGPGMLNSASEVVNCRCSMAPVLDVESET